MSRAATTTIPRSSRSPERAETRRPGQARQNVA
jgi:hypothetical protein